MFLTGCAETVTRIEYRDQALPQQAYDLPPMPGVPDILGPLCVNASRDDCLAAAEYLIDITNAARVCYGRVDWLREEIGTYE